MLSLTLAFTTVLHCHSYLATYKAQGRVSEAVELKHFEAYKRVTGQEGADLYGLEEPFERWSQQLKQTCKESPQI